MRNKIVISILTITTFLAVGCSTSGLTSSITKGVGPLTVHAPYANMTNFYGYVASDVKADGEYKGKDSYYLYFWVPAVIDEVGVAMYSPADQVPSEGDYKSAIFDSAYEKDSEAFFDTFIALEKMDIFDPEKIKDGGSVVSELATNDDSGEMPKNPAGQSYNSLLRHKSDAGSPLKALTRGVYRIAFTSFRGDIEGSFTAQVGTNIPGVVIASSLEELHKAVNGTESE
ncbi:LipL32 family surface lipoprotein [Spirochaeta cellobiosiphila]|uniref:LipL32 family surface lipoprotein n=1 Tax=Spirochaeta cellobiosiphila TaxID=504483 RepID=UPI0003F9E5E5|nr:LipL32 family surface lipoprotein [Spirochaeta cellobiosiphila]